MDISQSTKIFPAIDHGPFLRQEGRYPTPVLSLDLVKSRSRQVDTRIYILRQQALRLERQASASAPTWAMGLALSLMKLMRFDG